jgi:hypothetical protein
MGRIKRSTQGKDMFTISDTARIIREKNGDLILEVQNGNTGFKTAARRPVGSKSRTTHTPYTPGIGYATWFDDDILVPVQGRVRPQVR